MNGGDPDVTDQHSAVHLLRRIRFSITFYEERFLEIPSGQHALLLQPAQKFMDPRAHDFPGLVVVRLEGDPREPGLQRPP